jgi:mono/diheme cytochrome c family protein
MLAIALLSVGWTVYAHGDWKAPSKAASHKNPVVRDEASIGRGKELYLIRCAECHGDTGRGDMPGFKQKLKPNQIWDLVNFIQGLKI